MKKISTGYYKDNYKNIDFTVQKVNDLPNNEIAWYWQIGNQKVHDWYSSKYLACCAAKSYIDEQ